MLKATNFRFLGDRREGKVRDIYEQDDRLFLVATDRHTSFDRLIAHIPHKGQILNDLAAFWMGELADIVPNHLLGVPDPNVTIAKKCTPLRIEAVVRGYLTGSTDTAIWTRYEKGKRIFDGVCLPEEMRKNVPLPRPIFDPTTKEEAHDRVLTKQELIAGKFISPDLYERVREISLKLFERGQETVHKRGLILVDTKYEFGLDGNYNLMLIDEAHTPDSSRYWQLATYEERLAQWLEPENFDKEFLRLWFKANCDPYDMTKPLPEAPPEKIEELSRRYIAIYEQITGRTFVPGEEPALERIERNLRPYAIK